MITIGIYGMAAFIGALCVVIGIGVAIHLSTHRRQSFIVWFAPAICLVAVTAAATSGRDLSVPPDFLQSFDPPRSSALVWVTRFVSLFFLAASVERIVGYLVERARANPWRRPLGAPVAMILAYLSMWAGTVMIPSLFGAVPQFSHDFTYTALIGLAILMVGIADAQQGIRLARDACLAVAAGSLIAAIILPKLALETTYDQGFIPGLPRLAGLAAHAVSLGMITLMGLLCLWVAPYRKRWVKRAAWIVGLSVLLLTQSKTGWVTFLVCGSLLVFVRNGRSIRKWLAAPRNRAAAIGLLIAGAFAMLTIGGVVTFGNVDDSVRDFLATDEGAQLASLTGRDKIWAVALQEWSRYPWVGYGPTMFDDTYRALIGMPFATHGHNQVIDTLARSGLVGCVSLMIYWIVLTIYALKHAYRSAGLTVALLALLMLRAVSEVPFDLFGYSPENLPHFMLLALIAGCARMSPQPAPGAAASVPRAAAAAPKAYGDPLAGKLRPPIGA